MKTLYSVDDVTKMINDGEILMLAGDQQMLTNLPTGKWIAGTIPYFMSENGGLLTRNKIQVVKLSHIIKEFSIKTYTASELKNIPQGYQPNGFSYIVIPAFSDVHITFAKECSTYQGIFDRPLIGWISGFDLSEFGKISAKVINGMTGEISDVKAIVMHVELLSDKYANINTINLFKQGTGDIITFESIGFEVTYCKVNGENRNFAEYLISKNIDTHLPLVANYMGAMVNVSFQLVHTDNKKVSLYAPVFPGVEYKIATPVSNYEKEFNEQLHSKNIDPFLSCNCILNYIYANLEGKKTGNIVGPMTFGEIAYMLLNQTIVYLTIDDFTINS